NHWQTAASFYGNILSLGALIVGLCLGFANAAQGIPVTPLFSVLAPLVLLGLAVEGFGLMIHARDLRRQGAEGAASHYIQRTDFGKTYTTRNTALIVASAISVLMMLADLSAGVALGLWIALAVLAIAQSVVGRALFYVLVIPT